MPWGLAEDGILPDYALPSCGAGRVVIGADCAGPPGSAVARTRYSRDRLAERTHISVAAR
jgi:hypothetical protein